jgi:hypothetical protein
MWFTSEPSFRMSSFKTKIRRRKYSLNCGGGSSGSGPSPNSRSLENGGGCTKEAAAEWEFVNFNPVIYGRGRPLPPTAGAQPPPPPPLPDAADSKDVEPNLRMTPPPLPPRESSPMMPPPRPPPLITSSIHVLATAPLRNAAGTVGMHHRT